MANGKESKMPVATNDFQKSNGTVSSDHAVDTEGPSMTRQEFAAECDINTIMAQYDRFLSDPMMSLRAGQARYVDLDAVPQTLMESMQLLRDGEAAFYALPAVVRREFDNNPAAFLDYALDPTNVDQMVAWGLAEPKAPPGSPVAAHVEPGPAEPAQAAVDRARAESEAPAKASAAPFKGAPAHGST